MGMTVEELAERIGVKVLGEGSKMVHRCAGLEDAGAEDVSFLANRKYAKLLATSQAGAVVVAEDQAQELAGRTVLVAKDPYFAFRQAVVALHGFREHPPVGISEQAVIDPTAIIGQGCVIQPLVHIARGARIGDGCVIYPHCYVGPQAVLGDGCVLYPNVTVYNECILGQRVTVHSGCVIGQDGFGYATHGGKHHKIPHTGNVVIEDDVELGACCTVDRATVGSTRIGRGSKFSDLVAIGHGTTIGKHNLLVAQVGIAGSTQTGDYVIMGGQAGVAGHLRIGSMTQIAAKAGVMDDIPDNVQYGGIPAMPFNQTKRSVLAVARLPEMVQEFRKLQKRVAQLESQISSNTASSV